MFTWMYVCVYVPIACINRDSCPAGVAEEIELPTTAIHNASPTPVNGLGVLSLVATCT